jgi:hypothetical protein
MSHELLVRLARSTYLHCTSYWPRCNRRNTCFEIRSWNRTYLGGNCPFDRNILRRFLYCTNCWSFPCGIPHPLPTTLPRSSRKMRPTSCRCLSLACTSRPPGTSPRGWCSSGRGRRLPRRSCRQYRRRKCPVHRSSPCTMARKRRHYRCWPRRLRRCFHCRRCSPRCCWRCSRMTIRGTPTNRRRRSRPRPRGLHRPGIGSSYPSPPLRTRRDWQAQQELRVLLPAPCST